MLPAHRRNHFRVWMLLAVLLPVILLAGALLRPEPLVKAPQKIETPAVTK